jgi:putative SOS response-associated peptidase YedK
LAAAFELEEPFEPTPSFNVAPTQPVTAIRLGEGSGARAAAVLRWGLIPSWAEDPAIGNRMINAKAETAAEKPAFRQAFRRRRCLIAADGFYEWRKGPGAKQPFYIRMKGGAPFAFAGLWEHWEGEGSVIESCTILTTQPNDLVRPIHDRMPVILAPGDYAAWLDCGRTDLKALQALLRPHPAGAMEAWPVGPYVNNPRNNDARCIEPLRIH